MNDEQTKTQMPDKQSNAKSNIGFALLSPLCLLLAFFLPSSLAELIVFSNLLIGGLLAFGILVAYGYTNTVSHQKKEAALSYLLGNLLVFFVFLLKPV